MRSSYDFLSLVEKIIRHLTEEKYLDTNQLHQMIGGDLNTLQRALRSLVLQRKVRVKRDGENGYHIYWLPPLNMPPNIQHERALAAIYTALRSSGEGIGWIC